ncbi:MAG: DUF1553 domain-containing protein [Planctomycetota bacterium]|nr:DUF1553 domain-containing protein [Planctomycetota bacterium]
MAIGLVERPDPADVPIRVRGEVDKVGPVVARGFLSVLKNVGTTPITKGSGRLELAQWLTTPNNPLTARVYVNRVWSKLLGKGIVPTVDNFGILGEPASHPELLDHLSLKFVGQRWSTKKLIREIVLSHVYAESDEADPKLASVDKENKYFWHWNSKRLEAEVLRDAVLSIGGGLDLDRPNGTPLVELGTRELGPTADYSVVNKPYRFRSVYLPFLRGRAPEMLAVFDAPDPGLTVGIRDVTSGPDQALYLLNSPLALDEAQHFAKRLIDAPVSGVNERIDLAFQLALGQLPTPAQRESAVKFLSDIEGVHQSKNDPNGTPLTSDEIRLRTWSSFSQALFALPQFRYLF